MNILVTGSSGFIGNFLVKNLSKKYFIIATYNKSKPLKVKNVEFIKLNLLKKIDIKDYNIDLIIHCANYTPANHKKNLNMIKKNNSMMKNLINFANRCQINKFIYFSSVAVYKIFKKKEIHENSELQFNDFYSKSKIFDEHILRNWVKKTQNRKILIIRIPGVVGPMSHGNFISNLCKNIKLNKIKKIDCYNIDGKFNNILHVETLYNFIAKYIKNFNNKELILNPGSTYPMTIKQIIRFIAKKLNKKIIINNLGIDHKSFNININFAKKNKFELRPVSKEISKYLLKM